MMSARNDLKELIAVLDEAYDILDSEAESSLKTRVARGLLEKHSHLFDTYSINYKFGDLSVNMHAVKLYELKLSLEDLLEGLSKPWG